MYRPVGSPGWRHAVSAAESAMPATKTPMARCSDLQRSALLELRRSSCETSSSRRRHFSIRSPGDAGGGPCDMAMSIADRHRAAEHALSCPCGGHPTSAYYLRTGRLPWSRPGHLTCRARSIGPCTRSNRIRTTRNRPPHSGQAVPRPRSLAPVDGMPQHEPASSPVRTSHRQITSLHYVSKSRLYISCLRQQP
jgi:hypothetical protein